MLNAESTYQRNFINTTLNADLTVIGGGLSGVCCAITAARAGLKVTLLQYRSVLGGNASSDVRLTEMPGAEDQYIFILIHKNPVVKIQRTGRRITGILSLFNTVNPAVSNFGKQEAPVGESAWTVLNFGVRSAVRMDKILLCG